MYNESLQRCPSEEFYNLRNYLMKAYNTSPKALLAFMMATRSTPTDQNGRSMGNRFLYVGT